MNLSLKNGKNTYFRPHMNEYIEIQTYNNNCFYCISAIIFFHGYLGGLGMCYECTTLPPCLSLTPMSYASIHLEELPTLWSHIACMKYELFSRLGAPVGYSSYYGTYHLGAPKWDTILGNYPYDSRIRCLKLTS